MRSHSPRRAPRYAFLLDAQSIIIWRPTVPEISTVKCTRIWSLRRRWCTFNCDQIWINYIIVILFVRRRSERASKNRLWRSPEIASTANFIIIIRYYYFSYSDFQARTPLEELVRPEFYRDVTHRLVRISIVLNSIKIDIVSRIFTANKLVECKSYFGEANFSFWNFSAVHCNKYMYVTIVHI